MLTKITLENFKVFRYATEFPLAKINLLTGINGRGKSTMLQSILLFKQSIEQNENTNRFFLNGSAMDLGTMQDLKNSQTDVEKPIKIGFEFLDIKIPNHVIKIAYDLITKPNQEDRNSLTAELETCVIESNIGFRNRIDKFDSKKITIQRTNDNKHQETWYKENEEKKELDAKDGHNAVQRFLQLPLVINGNYQLKENIKFNNIHYVAADRISPKPFYEKIALNHFISVDKTSKNTMSIVAQKKAEKVHENLLLAGDNQVIIQISKWLSEILDNQVSIEIDDSHPYIITLVFKMSNGSFTPPNVGFAYSYILPIIVSGLIANEGEILIVENPEAHLHPKAQSRLTEFLAKVAATGVQVFVESHSDHILNALRVCVKQEKIAANDVNVLFFSNDKITQEPKVSFPKIDEDGRIDVWEDDFFDEIDKNLMNLL